MADIDEQQALAPQIGVGSRLKAARESAGFSLEQVAAQTRIPTRMLLLIEAGDFAALPARTYATGFTRTYARALRLDDQAMVAAVRAELGMQEQGDARPAPTFEPGDPARVPSARFAWLAAVAALAVVAAGLFFWRTYYVPAVSLPSLLPEETASAAPVTPPAPAPAPLSAVDPTGMATEAATDLPAAAPAPAPPAARRAPAPRRSTAPATASSAAAAEPSPAVQAAPPVSLPSPASTVQN